MITKITFKSLDFHIKFNNDELKKLLSNFRAQSLSKNYHIINKHSLIKELVLDQDESGNWIIYYKGKIFLAEFSKFVSENLSNNTKNIQKESIIKSPMPGLIAKIKVNPGDVVKKGDGLLTIEAMKMENEIKSPINGIVEAVKVTQGAVVEKNVVLVILQSRS